MFFPRIFPATRGTGIVFLIFKLLKLFVEILYFSFSSASIVDFILFFCEMFLQWWWWRVFHHEVFGSRIKIIILRIRRNNEPAAGKSWRSRMKVSMSFVCSGKKVEKKCNENEKRAICILCTYVYGLICIYTFIWSLGSRPSTSGRSDYEYETLDVHGAEAFGETERKNPRNADSSLVLLSCKLYRRYRSLEPLVSSSVREVEIVTRFFFNGHLEILWKWNSKSLVVVSNSIFGSN